MEYRVHHRTKVSEQQRLSFELNTLLESGDYGNVDVYCSPSSDNNVSVCIYKVMCTCWCVYVCHVVPSCTA